MEPWDEQFQKAARDWLLLRLETYFLGGERMTNDGMPKDRMTTDETRTSGVISSFGIRPSSLGIPSLDIPVPPKYASGDFKKSVW